VAEKQRTEAGVRRYFSVREHATLKFRRWQQKRGQSKGPLGLGFISDEDLIELMTSFALAEIEREKHITASFPVEAHRAGSPDMAEATKTFSPESQGVIAEAVANDATCYEKAKAKGEPTFTLRAQDMTAPQTILHWMSLNAETLTHTKLASAGAIAAVMRDWPHRKRAD
jgi:hypothetical protein